MPNRSRVVIEPRELATDEQAQVLERVLNDLAPADHDVHLQIYQTWRDAPVILSLKRGGGKARILEVERRILFSKRLESEMRDRLEALYAKIQAEEPHETEGASGEN